MCNVTTYIYIYNVEEFHGLTYVQKKDKISMMSWSQNFCYNYDNHNFLQHCLLPQWYNINRQDDNKLTTKTCLTTTCRPTYSMLIVELAVMK